MEVRRENRSRMQATVENNSGKMSMSKGKRRVEKYWDEKQKGNRKGEVTRGIEGDREIEHKKE